MSTSKTTNSTITNSTVDSNSSNSNAVESNSNTTHSNLKKTHSFKSTWHVWLIPVLAIAFSGWFLMKYYKERGETIYIQFSDASSIQPEKTKVVFRGVPVGLVKKISISKDTKNAVAEVLLQRSANHFAVKGSQFYLVTPKVGLEGVSGLDTLLSGAYIAAEPGNPEAEYQVDFKGNLNSSSASAEENTTRYIVKTDHAESITPGDNIFYRGLPIGAVSSIDLSPSGQEVLIQINIKNNYTRVVRTNTVFWKKQGIKADLGLFGSDIRINSLDTIMKGGIEIATPPQAGTLAKSHSTFRLLDDPPEAWEDEKWSPHLGTPQRKKQISLTKID